MYVFTVAGMAFLAGCGPHRMAMISESTAAAAVVPTGGTVSVGRTGGAVVVEIALVGIPDSAGMLAMGLRLHDGTGTELKLVRTLDSPSAEMKAAPEAAFAFEQFAGGPAMVGSRTLCLRVEYQLPEGSAIGDGSFLWLALGDPDSETGKRMGIGACISTRSGSPGPVGNDAPSPNDPQPDDVSLPAVCLRLEAPSSTPDGAAASMTPVKAQVWRAGGTAPVALVKHSGR